MRILEKGSKPIVRQIHNLKSKVASITQLKASLIDECNDEEPNTVKFKLGWLEGNSKKWLIVQEDLDTMYSKCTGNEICGVMFHVMTLHLEDGILNQVAQEGKKKKML